ncbi:MAG: anhydro-N-acetylmuramic acid kinase [Candidatus Latescibacteria bacterium]|nr:anhydro-N-acetylmuramic acid kinase [Candidatus Latescibacterota bacterium]
MQPHTLRALLEKRERTIIGLMSGTSADGISAALIRLREPDDDRLTVSLEAFETTPFPDGFRERVMEVSDPERGRVDLICRMNALVGELFAHAAFAVVQAAGIGMQEVDLIGSHGQTIHHLPDRVTEFGVTTGATLQIGDPSIIAQRTGVVTVGDFRPADIACGGQGAPLVPYVDHLLFRSTTRAIGLLNLGGIANITVLPAGATPDDVTAFDTGPGNMVIDAVAQALTGAPMDEDGRLAQSGTVCEPLVRLMLTHPFFDRPPPKSTGREVFGQPFSQSLLREGRRMGLSTPDLLATATALTVRSIAESYRRFIEPKTRLHELIISGGGVKNRCLVAGLRADVHPIPVVTVDERGVSSDAKECVAFAVLANETVSGRPGNLPGATGARRRAILGKICLP